MNFTYNPNQIALYDEQDKLLAEVTFPDTGDGAADIDHTFVDDSLQGQGIAGKLMEALAGHLRAQGKKAVLTCSYAVRWFEKHPEYHDLIK